MVGEYKCFISRSDLAQGLIFLHYHGRETEIDLSQTMNVHHDQGRVTFKIRSRYDRFKIKCKQNFYYKIYYMDMQNVSPKMGKVGKVTVWSRSSSAWGTSLETPPI